MRTSVPFSHQPLDCRRSAFTLLEVIVALGVFAVGMVAVIGLLSSVTKSGASAGEAEAAARVADSVQARLRSLPFDTVAGLLQDPAAVQKNDAAGNYNPNDGTHPAVLFAKLVAPAMPAFGTLDISGVTFGSQGKLGPQVLRLDEPLAGMGAEETERMLAMFTAKAKPAVTTGKEA